MIGNRHRNTRDKDIFLNPYIMLHFILFNNIDVHVILKKFNELNDPNKNL